MPKTEQQVKTQPHIKKAESNAEEGGSGVEEAVCEIAEVSQNMDEPMAKGDTKADCEVRSYSQPPFRNQYLIDKVSVRNKKEKCQWGKCIKKSPYFRQ